MRSSSWSLLFVSCVASAMACGNPGLYDDHEILTSPSGDWRLRFLDPPWELVDAEGPPVVLRIPSNAARLGGVDAAVLPRYELRVTVEAGDPGARARRDERRAGSRDEEVVVSTREVRTRSRDEGFEVITRSENPVDRRYYRFVYLAHPDGVLRLFFEGVPSLDEREVDVMVEGVEVLSE